LHWKPSHLPLLFLELSPLLGKVSVQDVWAALGDTQPCEREVLALGHRQEVDRATVVNDADLRALLEPVAVADLLRDHDPALLRNGRYHSVLRIYDSTISISKVMC